MNPKLYWSILTILFALCSSPHNLILAQTRNATATPSDTKRGEVEHQVQLQLLVASNTVKAKSDYPASLEPIVKQLKSSLAFKNHRLVASYLYNVADGSDFAVNDVTYAPFELDGVLTPTFFNVAIADMKLNANSDSIHISKFRFEGRKRIYIGHMESGGSTTAKPVVDSVTTGITTELNLRTGMPTIVGTTASGLLDGVLVVVVTVNQSGM